MNEATAMTPPGASTQVIPRMDQSLIPKSERIRNPKGITPANMIALEMQLLGRDANDCMKIAGYKERDGWDKFAQSKPAQKYLRHAEKRMAGEVPGEQVVSKDLVMLYLWRRATSSDATDAATLIGKLALIAKWIGDGGSQTVTAVSVQWRGDPLE